MRVCMRACVHARARMCRCVCVWMSVCVNASVYEYMCAGICVGASPCMCVCEFMLIYVYSDWDLKKKLNSLILQKGDDKLLIAQLLNI